MAAAAPRRNDSHEDGRGYGKIRKPFRRVSTTTTPYDRPPTAIRNSSHATNVNNSNGWLSKLVDPAQRLITSSAYKLFASVFRKRLPPPPPPQPPEPDANGGVSDEQQEAAHEDTSEVQGSAKNHIDYPASSSHRDGLTELELALKQQTFTRSEIDRLTAILQSKNIDELPVGNQDKKYEVFHSKSVLAHDRKVEFPNTPMKDDGLDNHSVLTPTVSSSVLDEDVASPAELAKAYMGNRPSKISPSVLGLRGQPVGENAAAQIDRSFAAKSPIMSIVPRSSSHVVPIENRFATPRSRGRSAIYNMARTPYSRVHSVSTPKGAGTEIDAFSAPSSSHSMWDSSKFSGPKHGALKRRSTVLESDIGSVGPIRRIRQKSNLLASSGTLSSRGTGIGSYAIEHPSAQKRILASEPSIGNGDNSIHGSGISSVSSKSSEMASKILQQLDVLVSSRDKSPTKLSPSMLRGPALRSLENVDSLKFLESVQDNNKLDTKHDGSLPDAQDSMSQKKSKVEENGPVKFTALLDSSASALNGFNPPNLVKSNASDDKTISFGRNSAAETPPQKKRAFQMSAHEDYLELDDDDHSDRTACAALSEEKEKLDIKFAENKATSEAIPLEKPATSLQSKPHGSSTLIQTSSGASDGFAFAEKSIAFIDQAVPLPGFTNQKPVEDKQPTARSDKALSPKESDAVPLPFSFGNNVTSPKEPNGFPPCNFSTKTEGAIPQLTFASTPQLVSNSTNLKFGISSEPKSESSSSFAFGAVDATRSLTKEHESGKASNQNNLKDGAFSSTEVVSSAAASMSLPATSIFSFGLPANDASVNGSFSSTSAFSSSVPSLVSQNISGQSTSSSSIDAAVNTDNNATIITTTANINNSSNLSLSAPATSFLSASAFKFSSSVVSSTPTSSIPATLGIESKEAKKNEAGFPFGSASSPITSTGGSLLSGPSSTIKSTESSIFSGTSSAVASGSESSAVTYTGQSTFNFNAGASTSAATTNQSQGFNPFSAASGQAFAAGTVFSTSTQSTPIQFSTNVSSPFPFTASTTFSSGSTLSSSSSSAGKLFGSGDTFGLTSSTSEANPVSSTTTTSAVFGSNWQTTKSPTFGSAINSASSSTGFVFGASSASIAVTNTTSMMFGSSPSAASGSVFNFNSAASATQLQPAFTPAFTSSPSGNNDQMNMEDSMAEDTVQAASTVPVFGQQSIAPPTSSFIFGSTTPGGNQFVSTPTVPPASSPFQFASQPNLAAPQNQTPFQASGSLEFNAGGSFSLGASGGDKSNRKFVRVSRKTQRKK